MISRGDVASLDPVLGVVHEAATSRKVEDPVALDLRRLTPFTDYFYICHGGSVRQAQAAAEAILEALQRHGQRVRHVEGAEAGEWILIDAEDVVIHVFASARRREFFSLERLWADAERVELPESGEAEG